jgi:hypothetical protein
MKRLLARASAVMFVAIVITGCGDTRESLAEESMSTMREMVAVLDTVKDDASAKAAKPKLKTLSDKLEDINQRASKLGTPTEAEVKALDQKHGKEMEELMRKMTGHMMRIAFDPKIQAELADVDMKGMK